MRYVLIALGILFFSMTSAVAQVSVGIALPSMSIGINLPVYPELVRVPGYPVYYAPRVDSNFFFYDGMYWVYQGDNWYASSWYNGPWWLVAPELVPLFILRIPVRYYRFPPAYFRGWRPDASPRWGERWGNEWERHRSGWDRWNRNSAPPPAPLPLYQRRYAGNRYPREEQQYPLRSQNYPYQPRDALVRRHYREQALQRAPAPSQRGQQGAPRERSPGGQQDIKRSTPPPPVQQRAPAIPRTQPQPEAAQREQPGSRSRQEHMQDGRSAPQPPRRGQEKDRENVQEGGRERNR